MAGPLVAIVGQTGAGKSDLAMNLAKKYQGEIICADAWTIRKGMDIGTAKPSLKDRQAIPHHLLDIVLPDEPFSAAEFQKRANVVIKDMHKRHKLPILVGGSALYIDSVLYNYSFLTTVSGSKRSELNNLSASELVSQIHKEHISTRGIDLSNKRRLIRLIETRGESASKRGLRQNSLIIGLKLDKPILESRLSTRLDIMLKNGLENEVKQLSGQYGWQAEALKGIGYREWQDYFSGSINESELKERITKDSLGLTKKQLTWFKRNKDIHWLSTPVNWAEVVDLMTTF